MILSMVENLQTRIMTYMKDNNALVSIVMPAYNCSNFIRITLDSVLAQDYTNWEVIVVDDCSTDNTADVIKEYASRDARIKYNKTEVNSGAAISRNTAVDLATGKYMAFLDSDDVWYPKKLSKQINFMEQNNYNFTCTNYDKIDMQGNPVSGVRKVRKKSNYNELLIHTIGNSTVIYNIEQLGKTKIPNIRKRNDYIMWIKVIKKAGHVYGLSETLTSYRIVKGSLSRNKLTLFKYHWRIYREMEHLSIIKSIYVLAAITIKKILRF